MSTEPLLNLDDDGALPTHHRFTSGGVLLRGNPGYLEAGGWRELDEADARVLQAADDVMRRLADG